MARFTVDFSPLRTNKNLRFIFISGVVTRFGSALTLVALPFQIKELTNSYIAVGAMGAVEIVPLIIFALWGGVLADSVDRNLHRLAFVAGVDPVDLARQRIEHVLAGTEALVPLK